MLANDQYPEMPLPQTVDQTQGSTHTGEFAAQRRRVYDVPPDSPPEKVRVTLRAEVENSLRDVCGNWPTGEFDRVVADVTATAMKYHGRERRRLNRATGMTTGSYVPGASAIFSFVMAATHSVQRFLQMETLTFR